MHGSHHIGIQTMMQGQATQLHSLLDMRFRVARMQETFQHCGRPSSNHVEVRQK